MEKFWELLEESVLVQASITLVLTLVIAVLLLIPPIYEMFSGNQLQVDTPRELWTLVGLVYGYYFGTKKDLSHRKELVAQTETMAAALRIIGDKELSGTGIREGFAIVTFGWFLLTLLRKNHYQQKNDN